jgi:hypothetical protein
MMLKKQNTLRLRTEKRNPIVAGPLTKLLIEGRIDILKWFLTIQKQARSRNSTSLLDTRLLKMLQKQKDLLIQPINERHPSFTSKIEVQGRIEMLEWLLVSEQ